MCRVHLLQGGIFEPLVMLNMYPDTVNFLFPDFDCFAKQFWFQGKSKFENSHSESNERWFSQEGLTVGVTFKF